MASITRTLKRSMWRNKGNSIDRRRLAPRSTHGPEGCRRRKKASTIRRTDLARSEGQSSFLSIQPPTGDPECSECGGIGYTGRYYLGVDLEALFVYCNKCAPIPEEGVPTR